MNQIPSGARHALLWTAVAILVALGWKQVGAQDSRPDPDAAVAAQKEAIGKLAFLDGKWRGPAWSIDPPTRQRVDLTQTERVGPFLDGAVRVIEGRGYRADGSTGFHAFATIFWDAREQRYRMSSHANGQTGDFRFEMTEDGFVWFVEAGPATIRYTATVSDGNWHEVGHYIRPGSEPILFFEMKLERLGDTDWPEAGSVGLMD